MRKLLPTLLLSLFSVLSLASILPAKALAYDISNVNVDPRGDFVLEPGKAEIFANPGDTVTKLIYVTDRIKGTTKFKVEIEDIIGSRDPNQPVVLLENGRGPNSILDIVKPDTTEFSLNFGQKITIPVQVTIPKNAQPGGYYGSVLISNSPQVTSDSVADTTQGSTRIVSRVGTLFFVRVNGPANESGNLEDFRLSGQKKLFYDKGPLTFQILYNNDGNVHLVPYGTVTIKNMWGTTVAELPIDAYFSLPNSLRYREVTWAKEFLLGRYTATVQLNRGYKNMIDTKTIAFWVIPWKLLVGVFVAIVIIVSLITFITKNFELKKKS